MKLGVCIGDSKAERRSRWREILPFVCRLADYSERLQQTHVRETNIKKRINRNCPYKWRAAREGAAQLCHL